MNLTRKNLAPIGFAFIFAFSCTIQAQQNTPRKFEPISEELANLVLNKREKVLLELETLKGSEWIGKYRAFDSATVTISFDWTPASGFTIWRENCSRPGDVRVNYGNVNFNGSLLTLSPERTEKSQHTYIPPVSLVPVKWGEQHRLIPSDRLALFAYAVNSGDFEEIEAYFVKVEDYQKPNEGLPNLPKEYKKYLNVKPIRAKVSALSVNESEYPQLTELQLNIGKAQGVIVGMKFYLIGVKDRFASIEITEVQENTSMARVGMIGTSGGNNEEFKFKVGWRFSSKMPEGY